MTPQYWRDDDPREGSGAIGWLVLMLCAIGLVRFVWGWLS